jgi:hypothetical protein
MWVECETKGLADGEGRRSDPRRALRSASVRGADIYEIRSETSCDIIASHKKAVKWDESKEKMYNVTFTRCQAMMPVAQKINIAHTERQSGRKDPRIKEASTSENCQRYWKYR